LEIGGQQTPSNMKKYVLPLLLFSLVAYSSQAQKLTPGIKGGLNISDVSAFNGDNRLSGHVGFFLHSKINSKWSFQPEILYSGQGQRYWVNRDEYTLALSYIQIPLMFQFHPVKEFYLEFGPQIGFLLSANAKNDEDKTEVDQYFRKVDAAIALGMGVQVTPVLGFYARYNAGLADVHKSNSLDCYNRVGQIGVAIKLK